jgi:DNA-directed RNA polymerase specialized sigma24 family protein
MRTINSRKKRFAGSVTVKDQKIYIDTSDGTGFPKVFELMKPHMYMLVRFGLSLCSWSTFEDIKQDIYILMLEGIPKYNPDRGASLSTFLHRFVRNRLIDQSRKKDPLRGRCNYVQMYDDMAGFYYDPLDPVEKIDLLRRVQCWDDKWRRVIFRIFISEDKIADVAGDEGMSPWGLTRAVRKRLAEVRELG